MTSIRLNWDYKGLIKIKNSQTKELYNILLQASAPIDCEPVNNT